MKTVCEIPNPFPYNTFLTMKTGAEETEAGKQHRLNCIIKILPVMQVGLDSNSNF